MRGDSALETVEYEIPSRLAMSLIVTGLFLKGLAPVAARGTQRRAESMSCPSSAHVCLFGCDDTLVYGYGISIAFWVIRVWGVGILQWVSFKGRFTPGRLSSGKVDARPAAPWPAANKTVAYLSHRMVSSFP